MQVDALTVILALSITIFSYSSFWNAGEFTASKLDSFMCYNLESISKTGAFNELIRIMFWFMFQ